MRLIDADALNEKLCETTIFIKDGVAFQRMINDAPTIDAVQVVRCKDCIHAQKQMTREEAINTLGNFKRYISGGGVTDRKANKAIDMAIEALKAEAVQDEAAMTKQEIFWICMI